MSASHFDYNGPRKTDPGANEVGIIVYGYWPSLALPIVAIITFAIVLAAQTYYAARHSRMYKTFHILMAVASVSHPISSISWTPSGLSVEADESSLS